MQYVKTELILGLAAFMVANNVIAHANFVPKDVDDNFNGRQYEEGTTAYMNVNIAHGCHTPDRSEWFSTIHVVSIFPNNLDLTGIAYTKDRSGNVYAGNALMGIKPGVDGDWQSINNLIGDVPTFYSHGARDTDVRSIHWINGEVPNDGYENLQFRAGLPFLEGCTNRLKVYVPTIQYCEKGQILAWFIEPTPSMSSDVISPGYAPYFEVVRNEDKNPLPDSCSAGETYTVYPAEEDLETYLLDNRYSHRKHKK